MVADFGMDTEMESLECHIFGCFAIGKSFKSYIDFKQIGHNSNQNMSCILKCIVDVKKQGFMPREKLLLQLDNTGSQNKNQYIMTCLGLLVVYDIFDEVQVDFLDVGHTHNDIDRHFSYFGKKFRCNGNETLEKMRENIAASFEDYLDFLVPSTELNDENWGINVWMKPYMYGLHGLAEYHHFAIRKFPEELREETCKVGLIYKRWAPDQWIMDIKPLFKSLPVGKPPIEFPSYKKINIHQIKITLKNLKKWDCLTEEHEAEWKRTFQFIEGKVIEWKERRDKYLLKDVKMGGEKKARNKAEKEKTEKEKAEEEKEKKVEFLECNWIDEWPLDELRRLCKEPEVEPVKEIKMESDGYHPEHTVLNKFLNRYPEPVTVDGEKLVKTHQNFILRDHIQPGKYVILFCDVNYCAKYRSRPMDRPWVAKILSPIEEEHDWFAYCYLPTISEQGKYPKYTFDSPDPELCNAPRAYYSSVMRWFSKSTGFCKSGKLKSSIRTVFEADPKIIMATDEYDKLIKLEAPKKSKSRPKRPLTLE